MTKRKNRLHEKMLRVAGGLLCIGMPAAAIGWAQAPAPSPAQQTQTKAVAAADETAADPIQQRKGQIAADTAKLDQLANELKAEMDKSNKDTLSLTVMRKAEEVEKLAHKLRGEIQASLVN